MSKPDFKNDVVIFCDGACSGNPGPGGWGSVISLPSGEVLEMGGFSVHTTNNIMELTALLVSLQNLRISSEKIWVLSDSVYVLRGASQWRWGWQKRNWKTADGSDVLNAEVWKQLCSVIDKFGKNSFEWGYVPGHKGVVGNERVDEIAVKFSKGERASLFKGTLQQYNYDITKLPESLEIPELDFSRNKEAAKPFSYLSYISGRAERHATWKECEARVKGAKGAKFKKAMSEAEQNEILKSWGVDPNTIK